MFIGGLAHPNLYEFIEIIQREQAATEVTIQQLEGGGRLRAKRRKVVEHEENIKRLTDDLCLALVFVLYHLTIRHFLLHTFHC